MGETDCGANWVLFWWVRPCLVNLWNNFLLMGGAVFLLCLTWYQTMVEVDKITLTCLKMSFSHTATLNVPNPAAGHCQPTPLPETSEHSQASLGQSLMVSLLLSPKSWCTQCFVCAIHESVSPVLCKFCNQIPMGSKVKLPGVLSPFARSPGWEICCGS